MQYLNKIKREIDKKTVVSVVVGMSLFGAITYALIKSGMKPLMKAAKAVK